MRLKQTKGMVAFREERMRMVVVVIDSVDVLFNEVIMVRILFGDHNTWERDDDTCHFNAHIEGILGLGQNNVIFFILTSSS